MTCMSVTPSGPALHSKACRRQSRGNGRDLQKGFDSNFGPRAEVLAIVLSNQRIAEQVWSEARANLTEAAFGDLAAKYSVEPVSRANFGKVPPIRQHSGQPTLEKAAFGIQPGELSSVIAVGEQFVIMYKQA